MTEPLTPAPGDSGSLDVVRNAVAIVCGVPAADLDGATVLADLGADSLALVSIADVVEAAVTADGGSVHIDDASLGRMQTLGEFADYVSAHRGELTRT